MSHIMSHLCVNKRVNKREKLTHKRREGIQKTL
jgi:hypothetical protein